MKKFLKNPYYLAWTIMLGIIVVVAIIGAFVSVLYKVETFLIGVECVYSAVLLVVSRKKKNINLDEFKNESEPQEKKFSFAQSEGRINTVLLVVALFLIGAMLVYFTFR